MELNKEWTDQANEIENKAHYSRDYPSEIAKGDGYIEGATDMLNTIANKIIEKIEAANLKKTEADVTMNGVIYFAQCVALNELLSELANIKPLNK